MGFSFDAAPDHGYRALFEAMDEGIAIHEAVFEDDGRVCDARIIDVNRRFLELFRLRKQEVVGRLITEVFDSAVRPLLREFLLAMEERKPRRIETYVPSIDRYLHISVTPFDDTCFASVVIDNTERKRAEIALEEERAFSNALIDSVPGIIYVYDAELRLIRWNRLHEELTGFSAEEMYLKNGFDWFDREDQIAIQDAQSRIENTGYNIMRARLICKSGERKPFLMTARRCPIGNQFLFLGIGIDLTELEKAEQAKADLESQLAESQKLESLGRLAGGVAHDFNNLLTVINGYADLLECSLASDRTLSSHAAEIGAAGARAAELTRQLLAFGRRQIIDPRPLDLNSVVTEAGNMLRRLVGEDIEFSAALESELGSVIADPGQIYQVLLNLAANARDAMPDGGKLLIETANVEFDEEHVRTHPEIVPGPCVLLAVTDTGVGMPEEVSSRIFEPFFTTKAQGHGTGLGLSMVYGIVRQSGGWIWVYSETGQGTTFKIYFPRTGATGVAPTNQAETKRLRGGEETILVVEDQEAVRRLAVTILASRGFQVLCAGDGEEAIAIAESRAGRLDLLLTDVVLPTMNGRQLAQRIQERHPETRVLFTSGYSENVIASRGVLKAGIAYLPKPFSHTTLLTKVRDVLDA